MSLLASPCVRFPVKGRGWKSRLLYEVTTFCRETIFRCFWECATSCRAAGALLSSNLRSAGCENASEQESL